jgi:hypothetical protein
VIVQTKPNGRQVSQADEPRPDRPDDWEFTNDENARYRNKFRAREAARNAVERKEKLADLLRVAVKTWPFQTAEELAELLAIACDAFKEAQHTRLLKVFRSKLEGLRQERRELEAQRLILARQSESAPAGRGSR